MPGLVAGSSFGPPSSLPVVKARTSLSATAQQQHEHERAVAGLVGHVAEMGEAGAEQQEGKHTEPGALDVASRPVERDGGDGNGGDGQRGEGDEEAVPVVECGEVHQQDAERDHACDQPLAEQPRGAAVFAQAEQAEDGHGGDQPRLAEQHRHDHQRQQHQPGAEPQPQLPPQCRAATFGQGQHRRSAGGEQQGAGGAGEQAAG